MRVWFEKILSIVKSQLNNLISTIKEKLINRNAIAHNN